MIAAWLSLTTGWLVTWVFAHAWAAAAFFVLLLVLAVWLVVIPLTAEPKGTRNAPRPGNPPWAGVTRAARRAASHARRLPGAIRTSLPAPPAGSGAPGLSAAAGHSAGARPGTTELHHEDRDGTATAAWLRTLRGPGWTVLALRRQLAVLGALIASGRAPGHTAASPHGEPGRPAGTQTHDGQVVLRQNTTGPALLGECDGGAGSSPALPVMVPAPPPHDPALWQPRPAEQTDWSLLAVLAPDLAAERRDAQTQAGA